MLLLEVQQIVVVVVVVFFFFFFFFFFLGGGGNKILQNYNIGDIALSNSPITLYIYTFKGVWHAV